MGLVGPKTDHDMGGDGDDDVDADDVDADEISGPVTDALRCL